MSVTEQTVFSRTVLGKEAQKLKKVVLDLARLWEESEGGLCKQVVNVSGVKASDRLRFRPLLANIPEADRPAILDAFSRIDSVVPGDDTLTFYSTEALTIRLPIVVRIMFGTVTDECVVEEAVEWFT